MNRTACMIVGFTCALMLALAPEDSATAAAPGTSSQWCPGSAGQNYYDGSRAGSKHP